MDEEQEPQEEVHVNKIYGKPRTFADRVAQVRQDTARAYDTVKQKTHEAGEAYKEYAEKREVHKEERRVRDIERYKKEAEYNNAKQRALLSRQNVASVKNKKWEALGGMFSKPTEKAKDYSSFQPSRGGLYSGDNFLKHIMGTGTGNKKKQKPINKDWWR